MLDFAAAMMDRERETETSHRRVLSMLHLNYAACDQVADAFEAQRVDFHGSRMHAVIVSPPGSENAKEGTGSSGADRTSLPCRAIVRQVERRFARNP